LAGWDRAITPTLQNLLHVPAYAVLAALALLGASAGHEPGTKRKLWIALACCAYGALLECAQAAVPGRVGSLSDALLNAAGVAVVLAAAMVWWPGRPREGRR